MSILIGYNYTAGMAIKEGQALALSADQTQEWDRVATIADGSTKIVGVALGNAATGEAVTAVSLVIGQQFKVIAGETVTKGDQLGLKVSGGSGKFYKAGPDAVTPYRVAALDNASADDLVQVVCFETMAAGAGGGFDVASLYAVDADGRPAIGALALYNILGLSSNVKYGDVIEVTSSITARVESLGIDGNNMVKSLGWTTPKKLPEGAKIRALNAWSSSAGPKPIILGIRTA